MALKIRTDQKFGGRRLKLGTIVITVDPYLPACLRPAMCIGFVGDVPEFKIIEGRRVTLRFVEDGEKLEEGMWTWKNRV